MRTLFLLVFVFCLSAIALCQGRAEFRADLIGSGKSKVVYKTRGANQAELEFEAERLPRNTEFILNIEGEEWTVRTNGFGRARLTQRFNSASALPVAAGATATLYNLDGDIVSQGTFVRRR
ncbi:MAG: hypothetical protein K1X67_07075 [Fimbriimonadaceae bacterium]|nr:hypothetical protein [Fimbriimonadaceae bacterium]